MLDGPAKKYRQIFVSRPVFLENFQTLYSTLKYLNYIVSACLNSTLCGIYQNLSEAITYEKIIVSYHFCFDCTVLVQLFSILDSPSKL